MEPWHVCTDGRYQSAQVMNPDDAEKYMDENTIGFVVMFGSTYNGQFEDVVKADKLVGRSAVSLSLVEHLASAYPVDSRQAVICTA